MRYRIYFTSGESTVINEWQFSAIRSSPTDDLLCMKQSDAPYFMVHIKNITHIVPEDTLEGVAGIVTPQSPESIAKAKAKEQDSIKSDPSAILNRMKEREQDNG